MKHKLDISTVMFDFDGVIVDSSRDICEAVNYVLELYNRTRLPNDTIIKFVGTGAKKLLRLCFGNAEASVKQQLGSLGSLGSHGSHGSHGLHGSLGSLSDGELDDHQIKTIYAKYLAYYMAHSCVETVLYPGMTETFKILNDAAIGCAIVTNKPEELTKKICKSLDIEKYFTMVIGPESLNKMKPDPEGINLVLQKTGTEFVTVNAKLAATITTTSTDIAITTAADAATSTTATDVGTTSTTTTDVGTTSRNALMIGDSDTDIFAGQNAGVWTCAVTYGLGDLDRLLSSKPDFTVNKISEILKFIQYKGIS